MGQTQRRAWAIGTIVICSIFCLCPGCSDRFEESDRPAKATSQPKVTTSAQGSPDRALPTRPAMRRAHVFISGRVQGVGFRAFTRYQALPLGLTGWVKNLRDGRVEAIIEGPAEKVGALLLKLRTGPASARVERLQVEDEPYQGQFKTFEVRF